jgi:ribonuclease VapC
VEKLVDLLAAEECAIGAPTLVETRIWRAVNLARRGSRWLEEFINEPHVSVIPFSRDMADAASRAFAAFGGASGHPATLNFDDCIACAVSVVIQAPLLFQGGDFGQTDVMAHPASIRT